VTDVTFPNRPKARDSAETLNGRTGGTIAERLWAVVAGAPGRIVFTTSFGIEDQLIAHHVFAERLSIEVVTLDTGRLFPETHRVWQKTEERYGAHIRAFHPDAQALDELVAERGINAFYHSRDARRSCCAVRKVEPLGRALAGASAWITGLRADQSEQRSTVELAEWDAERRLYKVSPLFDFTREAVVAECARLGVPLNELHEQGFASIGCAPCTRAIRAGEPERAGRWWWENDEARECGLHLDSSGRLVRSASA
jgi:phosphoadenosine phosphosulfate reductase